MRFSIDLLLLAALTQFSEAHAVPNIRGLKARYHPQSSSIFVEWVFTQPTDNIHFNVRYRSNRQSVDGWKHIRTSDTMVRLNLPDLQHNDELHVQVNAERLGHVIEDWSQVLVITVTKRIVQPGANVDAMVDEEQLLPPVDFTAHILDTTSVRLEWTPVEKESDENEMFYIVNVKQLTTKSGGVLQKQQIKTSANSFTMGKLVPGEKYELTIRTATSDTKTSNTAAIVEITMPLEDEYFEIGNLIISSIFKSSGAGVVNLTWDLPGDMHNKIVGYEVKYAESTAQENWKTVEFNGPTSTATLIDLKSDTEYLLKIKTILKNKVVTESGQFNFKTPKIQQNPIRKVDVIYSHDVNSVKLQWMLQPYVDAALIVGYDVYISENKDLPDSQWKHIPLNHREAALSLPNLKSLTTYYVRVNIRNSDGSVIRAPSLYRFKTIEPEQSAVQELRETNSLSYRNMIPGKVAVSWTYPESILDRVIGTAIFYTENKQSPIESWHRVNIHDPRNTSVVLAGMREGAHYFVRIVPRLSTGDFDFANQEDFELFTDTRERFEEQIRIHNPLEPEMMQQLKLDSEGKEYLRISSCDPDAIVAMCAWDEVCVSAMNGNSNSGWCVSYNLRDAILNS